MKSYIIHVIVTAILVLLYIPLSILGSLGLMATEGVGPHNTTVMNTWLYIAGYTFFCIPVICVVSILTGSKLYDKGRVACSYVVRCIPIILFVLILGIDRLISCL